MAGFNRAYFGNWGSTANQKAPTAYLYTAIDDDLAAVMVSGYFNDRSLSLSIGSLIYVYATDQAALLEVTAVSPNVTVIIYPQEKSETNPAFMASRSGAVTNQTGSGTQVQIVYNDASKLNIGGYFNTTTGKLDVPYDSVWHVEGAVGLWNMVSTYSILIVEIIAGSDTFDPVYVNAENVKGGTKLTTPFAKTVKVNQGDTIRVEVAVAGAVSDDITIQDAINTFSGFLVARL